METKHVGTFRTAGDAPAVIVDAAGQTVACACGPQAEQGPDDEFAARIVACINACRGMTDPVASIEAVRVENSNLRADRDSLRAANAELVAALRRAMLHIDTVLLPLDAGNQIRAALAPVPLAASSADEHDKEMAEGFGSALDITRQAVADQIAADTNVDAKFRSILATGQPLSAYGREDHDMTTDGRPLRSGE